MNWILWRVFAIEFDWDREARAALRTAWPRFLNELTATGVPTEAVLTRAMFACASALTCGRSGRIYMAS
jgi:hypothetical protein